MLLSRVYILSGPAFTGCGITKCFHVINSKVNSGLFAVMCDISCIKMVLMINADLRKISFSQKLHSNSILSSIIVLFSDTFSN